MKILLARALTLMLALNQQPCLCQDKDDNLSEARAKAREYALEYALKQNPEYNYYDGTNCANFVSQCLYASGAFPEDSKIWKRGESDGKYVGMGIWASSTGLRDWILIYGHGYVMGRYDSNHPLILPIRVGDVIFYDWDSDGTMNHVAIVTDIVDGVPMVSANSEGYRNIPWDFSSVCSQETMDETTWYVVHMHYEPIIVL